MTKCNHEPYFDNTPIDVKEPLHFYCRYCNCTGTLEIDPNAINWDHVLADQHAVDVDHEGIVEYYLGDENNGCYWQVGHGSDGYYYCTVRMSTIGKNADGIMQRQDQDIYTDEGPYSTYEAANSFGLESAKIFCLDNNITPTDIKK